MDTYKGENKERSRSVRADLFIDSSYKLGYST